MGLLVPGTGPGAWEPFVNGLGSRPWISKSLHSITSHPLKADPVLKGYSKLRIFIFVPKVKFETTAGYRDADPSGNRGLELELRKSFACRTW